MRPPSAAADPAPRNRCRRAARPPRTPARRSACRRTAARGLGPRTTRPRAAGVPRPPSRGRLRVPRRHRGGWRRRCACAPPRSAGSQASMPHADSTAESRGTITRFEIELARDIRHVQRGGAAEREDGEAPRIDAAAHGDEPDAFGHMRVDDAIDALGRGHAIDAELVGDAIDGTLRRHGGRGARGRRGSCRDRGSRGRGWRPSPSPRRRRGHSRRAPAARRRSRVRHAARRCGRRAQSSRRRRRCWRCPGSAAPRAGRRCAGPRRLPPRRRPRARCRSRCRPCRRE